MKEKKGVSSGEKETVDSECLKKVFKMRGVV